jgi:hypothetical protein
VRAAIPKNNDPPKIAAGEPAGALGFEGDHRAVGHGGAAVLHVRDDANDVADDGLVRALRHLDRRRRQRGGRGADQTADQHDQEQNGAEAPVGSHPAKCCRPDWHLPGLSV